MPPESVMPNRLVYGISGAVMLAVSVSMMFYQYPEPLKAYLQAALAIGNGGLAFYTMWKLTRWPKT